MAEKSGQQTSDALFFFEALQHVASPVVINVAEIAAQKGVKVNTVQKRFNEIKKRYNLSIQTTTVGTAVPATPTKPKVSRARITKRTPNTKKKATKSPAQVAKIAEQLEEEESEDELAGGVDGNINVKTEDEVEDINDDDAENDVNGHAVQEEGEPA